MMQQAIRSGLVVVGLFMIMGLTMVLPVYSHPQENSPSPTVGTDDLDMARIKFARKEWLDAIKYLFKARRENPKSSEIANMIGMTYLQLNNEGAAKAYFKRAIKLDPANAKAYNNLGVMYHKEKRYKSAIKYYHRAIEADTSYLLAYYNLGQAYFARKKYLRAIDVLHKIVQIDPEYLLKHHDGMKQGVPETNPGARAFYLAKLYAQAGDADKLIYFLQMSRENGYDIRKHVEKDKDFAPYLEDPRVQALLNS